MSFDPAQFKRIEREGYNRIGARYLAAAATRTTLTEGLLDAAGLAPGQAILDLAAGPGLLAQAARARLDASGQDTPFIVVSDIAEAQLACCPPLPRVAADGERLPFAARSFDRVLCGLGLMLFPAPEPALAECRRVLRGDGRLALSVWGRAEDVPLLECALACLRRCLPPPRVERPSVFRFGDPATLDRLLAAAGLGAMHHGTLTLHSRFATTADYWQAFLDLAGGAAGSLARLPAAQQAELAAAVAHELAPYADGDGYALASTVRVVTATPV